MDSQHMRGAGEVGAGVVVDPDIMHGVPVIAGTRIPVRLIVGQMAGGESIEALMQAYDLTEGQIRAALRYAAERLGGETVLVVGHAICYRSGRGDGGPPQRSVRGR